MSKSLQTVLYAEDDPDIQNIARIALERVGGLTVEICDSGTALLAAVEHITPDLILLDVMMPGVDGPQTLATLQSDSRTAGIPVIFITAKGQTSEIEHLRSLGAIGVVRKPFDPMTLADQVRAIWDENVRG
ncbi:response regulator [Elongatibacter sediminis]|uniref:Response regulator n=1 Tax=Elongatibacter sediminis TaxID=3119006 RepID=A0AAW9R512_9GAMM